eukprot:620975-Pyramimonas_sp.AAC.1
MALSVLWQLVAMMAESNVDVNVSPGPAADIAALLTSGVETVAAAAAGILKLCAIAEANQLVILKTGALDTLVEVYDLDDAVASDFRVPSTRWGRRGSCAVSLHISFCLTCGGEFRRSDLVMPAVSPTGDAAGRRCCRVGAVERVPRGPGAVCGRGGEPGHHRPRVVPRALAGVGGE